MVNELIKDINSIHEEMKEITKAGSCGEYVGPAEYQDTKTIVDSVLRSGICRNLLTLFWNRTHDACPFEASEAERQEKEFNDWLLTVDFDHLVQMSSLLETSTGKSIN